MKLTLLKSGIVMLATAGIATTASAQSYTKYFIARKPKEARNVE